MMPFCFWKGCKKVGDVYIGKIWDGEEDNYGNKWDDPVYLCKKHAKKLWKKLEMGPDAKQE